jgi:hypothetical protein
MLFLTRKGVMARLKNVDVTGVTLFFTTNSLLGCADACTVSFYSTAMCSLQVASVNNCL